MFFRPRCIQGMIEPTLTLNMWLICLSIIFCYCYHIFQICLPSPLFIFNNVIQIALDYMNDLIDEEC